MSGRSKSWCDFGRGRGKLLTIATDWKGQSSHPVLVGAMLVVNRLLTGTELGLITGLDWICVDY